MNDDTIIRILEISLWFVFGIMLTLVVGWSFTPTNFEIDLSMDNNTLGVSDNIREASFNVAEVNKCFNPITYIFERSDGLVFAYVYDGENLTMLPLENSFEEIYTEQEINDLYDESKEIIYEKVI